MEISRLVRITASSELYEFSPWSSSSAMIQKVLAGLDRSQVSYLGEVSC
jgi:hypothetical protein